MTIHEEVARQCIAPLWTADFVYGVPVTTLKRPGRGRSAQGSNTRGWRYENRPRELERFDTFVGELVNEMRLLRSVEWSRVAVDPVSIAAFARSRRPVCLRRFQFKIRQLMLLTAYLAGSLAYLVAAEREGRPWHCGIPLATAELLVVSIPIGFFAIRSLIRMLIFAIRHPS